MTALYYKAGDIPWQLERIPQDTCFVGVSFYKESPHPDAGMQSSLAQVFSGARRVSFLKENVQLWIESEIGKRTWMRGVQSCFLVAP